MTILLTGFEPFGGETINPSWQVAKTFHETTICGQEVISIELPCVFGLSVDVLTEAINAYSPSVILSIGQAGGRKELCFERVAINIDDARIADNNGMQPVDVPVVADGPDAYFTNLPVKAILASIRQLSIDASLSNSAGTYVCNHVFYALMHAVQGLDIRAGFAHIPYLPEQVIDKLDQACMPMDKMIAGMRKALETAVNTKVDIKRNEGALD